MCSFAKIGPTLKAKTPQLPPFYADLTERWPEIDSVPEQRVDDKAYCPWSCALNRSGMAVVMCCVWSMADELAAIVEDLANRHRLVKLA